jgi:hypothetical protein
MAKQLQTVLFDAGEPLAKKERSSTFTNNMSAPVHRWFRYSAGFGAEWVETVIQQLHRDCPARVFDPFAGSGTTLLAAERVGAESKGIDSHPFVARIARAKLAYRTDPHRYLARIEQLKNVAGSIVPSVNGYPPLIAACYDRDSLLELDALRQAFERTADNSPQSELVWLTLISILRKVSKAGTAQWQYVLPAKQKRSPMTVPRALADAVAMFFQDMMSAQSITGPAAEFLESDARTCAGVPTGWANLVVTSPPYPNNYDYADATRLEMSFLRQIRGWGDLQASVRQHLVRSCSQHVPEKTIDLSEVIALRELEPIRDELVQICDKLAEVRKTKGGKKTYHLMIGCYFHDLALVWHALRRVCDSPCQVCFVVGDSAPYGVYVPVVPWLSKLAEAAGFHRCRFEKTRDRNVKWKNRKHRVPLLEGRLWAEG